jgi:hypothetical protein
MYFGVSPFLSHRTITRQEPADDSRQTGNFPAIYSATSQQTRTETFLLSNAGTPSRGMMALRHQYSLSLCG